MVLHQTAGMPVSSHACRLTSGNSSNIVTLHNAAAVIARWRANNQVPGCLCLADASSLKDVFSAFAGFGIHTPTPTKAEPVFHTHTAKPTTVRCTSTPGSAADKATGMDSFRCVQCVEALVQEQGGWLP